MPALAVDRSLHALLGAPALGTRRVLAVWLFGSHVRGTANEGSDVDLAVLCEPPLGLDRAAAMDHASSAAGAEVDVVDLATANPALAWEVITTGRILLERDSLATERFVRSARFAAEDAARRDRMVLLAQTGSVGGAKR